MVKSSQRKKEEVGVFESTEDIEVNKVLESSTSRLSVTSHDVSVNDINDFEPRVSLVLQSRDFSKLLLSLEDPFAANTIENFAYRH
jgi:hypothetical protein